MQAQRIGIYNQFSTNRNQQKQTKNPIGFGMRLLIGPKEEEIIKRFLGKKRCKKVAAFVNKLNLPKNMYKLFSKCYKELYPNEAKVFTPDICEGFDRALAELLLVENSSGRAKFLSFSVIEKKKTKFDYVGVGYIGKEMPISPKDFIKEIKAAFISFAKERIIFDTSYKNKYSLAEEFRDLFPPLLTNLNLSF